MLGGGLMASARSARLVGGQGAKPHEAERFGLMNFPWNSIIYTVFHILLFFRSSDLAFTTLL